MIMCPAAWGQMIPVRGGEQFVGLTNLRGPLFAWLAASYAFLWERTLLNSIPGVRS